MLKHKSAFSVIPNKLRFSDWVQQEAVLLTQQARDPVI